MLLTTSVFAGKYPRSVVSPLTIPVQGGGVSRPGRPPQIGDRPMRASELQTYAMEQGYIATQKNNRAETQKLLETLQQSVQQYLGHVVAFERAWHSAQTVQRTPEFYAVIASRAKLLRESIERFCETASTSIRQHFLCDDPDFTNYVWDLHRRVALIEEQVNAALDSPNT